MRWTAFVVSCALTAALSSSSLAASVHAVVAAEARVAVYSGAKDGSDLELIGSNTYLPRPGQIDTLEYSFEVEDQRFIFVLVWANQGTSGMLADFVFNGVPVLSGDPAWQVYNTALRMPADAEPLGVGALTREIRTATRRYAWEKAAAFGINGTGPAGRVQAIAEQATWMWRPADPVQITASIATPDPAECLLFRISPTELWPEIELWHGRNVGRNPEISNTYNGNSRYYNLGGGSGGSGGSGIPGVGGSSYRVTPNPFSNFEPPGSSSREPKVPDEPDEPNEPDKPKPPPVPEPATLALLLLAGAASRRR